MQRDLDVASTAAPTCAVAMARMALQYNKAPEGRRDQRPEDLEISKMREWLKRRGQ